MGSDNSPLISFVVPCYNYGVYLGDCLQSIFKQTMFQDFEIIAIDDASTDNTQQVLAEYADPRLRVMRHPQNQGHVVTINEGFALAKGKYIARIDPDDRYRSDFLANVVPLLERYPHVGMVYGDCALIDPTGRITLDHSDRAHNGKDFLGNEFVALLRENIVCAPTTIARKEIWRQALPIPDGLSFSDWYLSLQMARRCDFYYTSKILADYRVHPMNHHTKVTLDRSEEATIKRLLDQVFSENEIDAALERSKQKAKKNIFSTQYVQLADKYFGARMHADARRCYVKAFLYEPLTVLSNAGYTRRFFGTLIGRTLYDRIVSLLKGV